MNFEICTPNFQSALNAEKAGANRIELCENLIEGGTTPSAGMIKMCKKHLSIPVYVLIRPRGGDFCYSDTELEIMIEDIDFCKTNGVDGVVIGALNVDRTLHIEQCQAMIKAAGTMGVTFHRAFDRAVEPLCVLEQLKKLGVERILTSGQAANAELGISMLKKLVEVASDDLSIMPGAGVNAQNIKKIITETGCKEVHFSAKNTVFSKMKKINNESFADHNHFESDFELIRDCLRSVKALNL